MTRHATLLACLLACSLARLHASRTYTFSLVSLPCNHHSNLCDGLTGVCVFAYRIPTPTAYASACRSHNSIIAHHFPSWHACSLACCPLNGSPASPRPSSRVSHSSSVGFCCCYITFEYPSFVPRSSWPVSPSTYFPYSRSVRLPNRGVLFVRRIADDSTS